jgi:hypothetical protein
VRAQRLEGVGKSMNLGKLESMIGPRSDDDATAGRTEIDGRAVKGFMHEKAENRSYQNSRVGATAG